MPTRLICTARGLALLVALLCCALFAAGSPSVRAQSVPEPRAAPEVILGDPPVAPRLGERALAESQVAAIPASGLAIDTSDREAVRVYYRGLFSQSDGVAMGWTGSYATGNAGTTSQLHQNAVALRINWYRALAGVPANVALFATYNAKDQQAALMMSVNNQLSHTPPSNWIYYTADGAEAAGKSNLALGSAGPDSVSRYMVDTGTNNAAVGHRRWLLYPQTLQMGSGDVPGGTFNGSTVASANALWVLDSNFFAARPPTRDSFVAWPPKGYVPYQVVPGRWSFSMPGANFSQAAVSMTPGGPVSIEPITNGFGENTIVWLPQGFNSGTPWPKPSGDQTHTVTVSNVLVNGTPQSFTYSVVIFDPDVVTPGAAVTTVIAPASAVAQTPFSVSVQAMPRATAYEVNLYRSSPLAGPLTPANSASAWTADVSSGYTAIGATEFHLRHSEFRTQILNLNKDLHVGANASIAFDSRLGLATTSEIAKVQISLDDGVSWQDVFSQAGTNTVNNTVRQTIALQAYAGRIIKLRFAFVANGSFYNVGSNIGWFFTNIAFGNVSELTLDNWATLPASPSLIASSAGTYRLNARTEYQGSYFTEWGPSVTLQVTQADVTAPSVPQTLTAAAARSDRIDLTWAPATDAVGVTQYRVYRSTDNFIAPIAVVSAPTTSYSDTGLSGATRYSYKVAACDAAGNCSTQSATAAATTLPSIEQLLPAILMLLLEN